MTVSKVLCNRKSIFFRFYLPLTKGRPDSEVLNAATDTGYKFFGNLIIIRKLNPLKIGWNGKSEENTVAPEAGKQAKW